MLTVIGITVLRSIFKDSAEVMQMPYVSFLLDPEHIAIPAVIVSVLTLILVSLVTVRPEESDWRDFIEA